MIRTTRVNVVIPAMTPDPPRGSVVGARHAVPFPVSRISIRESNVRSGTRVRPIQMHHCDTSPACRLASVARASGT